MTSDRGRPGTTLSTIDRSALYWLEKYGEMMLDADGYFTVPGRHGAVTYRQMLRLQKAGHCRIDRVGESTFAVLVT